MNSNIIMNVNVLKIPSSFDEWPCNMVEINDLAQVISMTKLCRPSKNLAKLFSVLGTYNGDLRKFSSHFRSILQLHDYRA